MPYTQEWIESSMARLEEAERERERHERALETVDDPTALRMHSEAIEALDEEIQDLYTKLEEAAAALEAEAAEGDEDGGEAESEATEDPGPVEAGAAAAPDQATEATEGGNDGFEDPFGRPAAGAGHDPQAPAAPAHAPTREPAPAGTAGQDEDGFEDPFGRPAAPTTPAQPTPQPGAVGPAFASYDPDPGIDDDLPGSGGALKWLALVVVLGAAGAGGFYWWQGQKAEATAKPPAPTGPVKVIKAAPVPEDTQGPRAAKGGEATRTPGMEFSGKRRRTGGSRGPRRRPAGGRKGQDGRTLSVDDTRDPLAGLK